MYPLFLPEKYLESLKPFHIFFLAVQDSSIGDSVTHKLSESSFDFSDFREHCRAVVVDTSRH